MVDFTHSNAQSFDWHDGESSQEGHDHSDDESSRYDGEAESLEEMMAKRAPFKMIPSLYFKLDHLG